MHFDQYTIVLLVHRPDGPQLDEQAAAALQDAHMNHLPNLHEAGDLLIAGPLFDPEFRGLSILKVNVERAKELKEEDAAVRAGIYAIRVIPWTVPAGAMAFSPAHLPRSMSEVVS
jgi:uncharacterized protein YciI